MSFENKVQGVYEVVLERGATAIDVGAHLGRHLFHMVRAVGIGGKVLAFEPLPMCRKALATRMKYWPKPYRDVVELLPWALRSETGSGEFVVAVDALGLSGLRERVYDVPTRTVRVPVELRRLDDMIQRGVSAVSFVKIDAEGGEYHILKGAQRMLAEQRPVIGFKFGMNAAGAYEVDPKNMAGQFLSIGYRLFDILGRELSSQDDFAASIVRQDVWDYVAIPGEQTQRVERVLAFLSRNDESPRIPPLAERVPDGVRHPIKKILMMGTYPIVDPAFGGPIRVSEIKRMYHDHGYSAEYMSVCATNTLGGRPRSSYDFTFSATDYPEASTWMVSDYISGQYAVWDIGKYVEILGHVRNFRPDAIELEQPFLLPLVEQLVREPELKGVRIVYSSQNIEAGLKLNILNRAHFPRPEMYSGIIEALEKRATRSADLVVAVTDSDAAWLSRAGAARVVVAPNGCRPSFRNKAGRLDPAIAGQLAGQPYALFVSSAYPPNASGYFEMIGSLLGFLPPDRKLVLAGSVTSLILADAGFQAHKALNMSRLVPVGHTAVATIEALLANARVIILPILYGGGSNLKTPEALASGKFVVTTSVAMRSFEKYRDLPGVQVEDDPRRFRQAIQTLLLGDQDRPDRRGFEARMDELSWMARLNPIADAVARLSTGRG